MAFIRRTSPRKHQTLGIAPSGEGVALCLVRAEEGRYHLEHCDVLAAEAPLAEALAEEVRRRGWKGLPCNVVLPPEDYKLLPTEAPDVPEAELNQALLWGLRDLLDWPPQDTVLDSFPFASGLARPGKRMRYAVAAPKVRLLALAEAVQDSGLALKAIDIPELALRNLMSALPDMEQGLALVAAGARGLTISVYRDGELYLARPLAGIADLSGASHPLTAPGLADQLSLEILRTLDYYDSQLNQRPLKALYLQPLAGDTGVLQEILGANLPLAVERLDFSLLASRPEPVPGEVQARCLNALGGALRQEAVA